MASMQLFVLGKPAPNVCSDGFSAPGKVNVATADAFQVRGPGASGASTPPTTASAMALFASPRPSEPHRGSFGRSCL